MIPAQVQEIARDVGLATVMRAVGVGMRFVPIPQPTLLVGSGASARLGQSIASFGHRSILIVTDKVVAQLGLLKGLTTALAEAGVAFKIFDEITPDAPIALIERGIEAGRAARCDAIVAFGGGSAMDSAKTIGLAIANNKHPRKLAGYFKGRKGPMPLYAVPTTAGTGSEVTVAAVISDPEAGKKHVIADLRIVPRMAALDPDLMAGLPPAITAATGMDALTHAVEAYIGNWATPETDRMALSAVTMIYDNLPKAYADGKDLVAREKMALASTYAGMAFTRANVGFVHAIAHQLGGLYHTPHGLANAIVLPHVLRWSAPNCIERLAQLAVAARVGKPAEDDEVLAEKFMKSVESMNQKLGIPPTLEALKAEDIPRLAKAACWEANTNYPVPRYMSQEQCEALLAGLLAKPKKTKK